MSNRLFDANDILKLYNTLDKRIDKLWCFAENCCEKAPINIGEGKGLYKRLYRNQWEFKSLVAGTNVTITENTNDLTISASGGSAFIESVTDTATINLTVTGTALSADFTSLLISQFTNDVPYLTGSTGWKLLGNAGTDPLINFVGTIDAQDFIIRAGNTIHARFQQSTGNTIFPIAAAVIIGSNGNTATGNDGLVVGNNSSVVGNNSIAVGTFSTVIGTSNNSFSLGSTTNITDSSNSFAVGNTSSVNNSSNSIAAGSSSVVDSSSNSFAFGDNMSTQASNSFGISLSILGATLTQANTFAVMNGTSGFGTVTPSATVDIVGTFQYVDTTQGAGKVLTSDASGNASWATLGSLGAGTVTSVSVVTNQGVSGSVATATTTPAITLSLGALTGVTSLNGLVVTANTGVITTGTWNATPVITTYGGTGLSSYTQGDTLYYNSSTTLSKLAKTATAARYISNTGTSNNPAWNLSTIYSYTAQTSAYNVTSADYLVDGTSGTFTMTLPTAVGILGQSFCLKNTGTGVVTVATTSSQTIDGTTTFLLYTGESITVESDNANWKVIAYKQSEWIDWSSTVTLVGWSVTTYKSFWYYKNYRAVTILGFVSGTSNSTSTTFTLPITTSSVSRANVTGGFALDNGVSSADPVFVNFPPSVSTVTAFLNFNAAAWTAAGTKQFNFLATYKID